MSLPRRRRARPALLCCALAAALVSLPACAPRATERIERVAERLSGEDFSLPRLGVRPAVVAVGGEAREVLWRPEPIAVAGRHVVHFSHGAARVRIPIPQSARSLSDSAFELVTQLVPFAIELDEKTLDTFERKGRYKRRERGWTLQRDRPDATEGELRIAAVSDEEKQGQLLVRLRAHPPPPALLRSRSLTLPADAVLELAYVRLRLREDDPAPETKVAASLECPGRLARPLHEASLPAGETPTWHEVSVRLGATPKGCRLVLETRAADGSAPRLVWARPRILTASRGGAAEPPSLILISLDTLRADHLSGYGYPRLTSPAIDARLIAAGTTFLDVSTSFPRTDVAHLSLFTSLSPSAQPERGRLAADVPVRTLPEQIQRAGYQTAAFTEDALVGGPFGFWYGFDRFVEFPYESDTRGRGVFREGERFLREHAGRRFFLFLHTYKVHFPRRYAPRYAALFHDGLWENGRLDPRVAPEARREVDDYDRTIREADDLVAGLLDEIERLGLDRRTVVVLLSDHGEAFGEHGIRSHGYAFHQEQLRIPLVFRGPGIPAGRRVATPVGIVDVAPTLLDLAGAPQLADAEGVSLRPIFAGEGIEPDRPLFFRWIQRQGIGVRIGRWKSVRRGSWRERFDLSSDPREQRPERARHPLGPEDPLFDRHLERAARLRARANASGGAAAAPIDEQTERSLRALGYVD